MTAKGHLGPIVRAWRKNDREDVRALVDPLDFVLAVDPGSHGMACLFPPVPSWEGAHGDGRIHRPPNPIATYPLQSFYGVHDVAGAYEHVLDTGNMATRLLVVMEESFAGGRGNSGTDLAHARLAGAVIGALSSHTKGTGFDVALVRPAVWISALAKVDHKIKRKERKEIAKAHAEGALGPSVVAASAPLAPHREAFCDAYGIATWWGKFARATSLDLYGTR